MEWLLQNWIWIAFAAGIFFLMRSGGMGCGMGHGHHGHGDRESAQDGARDLSRTTDEVVRDPVSGATVDPVTAVNVMYQGRVYYFASRENRDQFEAQPQRYAQAAGAPAGQHRHHHHHGC